MDVIRDACRKEQALFIRYASKSGDLNGRTILPLAIMYTDRTLPVLARYNLREGFRMSRPERMLEVRTTGGTFRPKRVTLLRASIARLNGDQERL